MKPALLPHGEEALKKILKNEYSVIILDVQMPDMDGHEVDEAISGLNKNAITLVAPTRRTNMMAGISKLK